MKIEIHEGCLNSNIIIDGKSIMDMTDEEHTMILEELIEKAREAFIRREINLVDFIELFQYEDYETGSMCDQCGDCPATTTYNI